jgi:hypothetical protein
MEYTSLKDRMDPNEEKIHIHHITHLFLVHVKKMSK